MTTSIKLTAHCNPETTQVLVRRTNDTLMSVEEILLEDGETFEYYVYDDKVVTVKEVKKL